MMAGGPGNARVARDQSRVERFRQRDIGGVIGRQIVSQLPYAGQQEIVPIAAQRKIGKVGQGRTAAGLVDLSLRGMAADHLGNFDIDQIGRMQGLARIE